MPDQPDDAPKRQQRGVFPPFFAPRNGGRPDGAPTPPSGSWRRVSRLFTPPEGTRQRRTPAAPQTPYTPPARPTEPVVPVESLAPAPGIDERPTPPAVEALEAMFQAEDPIDMQDTTAASLDLEHAVSEEMATELEAEAQGEVRGGVVDEDSQSFYAPALETGDDSLDAIAELGLAPDADDFMVESLEHQPISLEPSDAAGMDVAVESVDELLAQSAAQAAADPLVSDVTYDEMFSATSYADGESVQATPTNEELESVERYLAEEPAVASDRIELDALEQQAIVEYQRESLVEEEYPPALSDGEPIVADDSVGNDALVNDVLGSNALEVDPWAGAELPEPAFGSIGWPPVDADAPASEAAVDDEDEMSAALAWSDAEHEVSTDEDRDRASHDDAIRTGDDALSAMMGELRDSSSAWKSESDSIVDEKADVEARAHFYAAPEPIDPADELAAAMEQDMYSIARPDAEGGVGASVDEAAQALDEPALSTSTEAVAGAAGDAADDYAGAAIADALARVAARIRSGEVELPSEAAGTSDESALAAALAALLRGPRR